MAVTVDSYPSRHRKLPETRVVDGEPVRFSDVLVERLLLRRAPFYRNQVHDVMEQWSATPQAQWIREHVVAPLVVEVDRVPEIDQEYCNIWARLSEADQVF